MTSELTHRLVTEGMYPVLQLSGVLDAGTARRVRSILLGLLAHQPEAVVVDVTGVRLAEPGALQVLRDVARETADWPAAHLVLCAADGDLWRATGLTVWPGHSEAFTHLGTADADHYLSLALDPVLGAARRSRELVTEACGRWDRPELAGPACIVVTEMVNNVVAHAHTPMTVFLARHGEAMSVAVRDESPVVPEFSGPVAPTSYGGRGLLLIDAVAARWGNLRLDDGKVVWAVLEDQRETASAPDRHLGSEGMADPARG
ncbi:ATP-binding protein [Jidongwangia harbinensis]|uniref:ATP-binding protein n=1 Tax=Jidongwangia harbinensis TaxID=2878561 RepID=UPI001CDA4ED9|nr:ATP-binding protein [Jidongwangia harbinensis]MCA2213408.1 anti-anti-sigma factor [Jidongwangia harbinensis]